MLAVVIMAGGSGERFWPLSTPEMPKQLLKIISDKTMIRETVDRILPLVSPEQIFITTNELQEKAIRDELTDIPNENIIIEPAFKDTAAAIGYSLIVLEEKIRKILGANKEIEVLILASDHLIQDEITFREIVLKAVEEVKKNKVIVTLGVKPNKPETGYGYIEIKDTSTILLKQIYKVKKFREKPNLETAEAYIASEKYLWNSGIFIFSLETIFKNFEVLMEDHMEILNKIKSKVYNCEYTGLKLTNFIREDFEKFEKISIDFGIMEHSKNIRVIPVDIGWNDIGSFNALDDVFDKNDSENIIKEANVVEFDSRENIVIGDKMNIVLLGVKNLVIAKKGENLLIANKNNTQDIKKILYKLNL